MYEGAFDGNNVGASIATMQLLPAPSPDLTVQAVGGPASLVAGLSATFTWTVANVGEATAGGSWTDTIYLSHDGSVLGALAIASVVHAQPLAAAGTYTASVTVTLPAPTDGSYRIVVVTDANGQVFEHGREANNTGASTPVDLGHMNLTATSVTAPPTAQSAGAIDVQWSVTNTGTSAVTGTWNDQLYLSQDGLIGSGDRLLTTITHTVPLGPQATYVVSAGITLPVDVSGAWQLIVRVDANGAVVEPNAENDNTASAPITIALAPYADLASAIDSAPTQLIADPARVTVTWTVTNNGTGAGLTSSWTDNVVLSRDSVAGNGDDIVLGRFTHDGPLAVGTSYSRTETMFAPATTSGRFTVFVIADATGVVFENGSESNNVAAAGAVLDLMPIPYADLRVTDVTVPATALSGTPLTVTWTVRNDGIGRTDLAAWSDTVTVARAGRRHRRHHQRRLRSHRRARGGRQLRPHGARCCCRTRCRGRST